MASLIYRKIASSFRFCKHIILLIQMVINASTCIVFATFLRMYYMSCFSSGNHSSIIMAPWLINTQSGVQTDGAPPETAVVEEANGRLRAETRCCPRPRSRQPSIRRGYHPLRTIQRRKLYSSTSL